MDRICNAVLEKVNTLATLGRYVIISDEEFYESFPEVENKSDALNRALKFLQSEGYVDVRYSRQNLYCVAPLKTFEAPPPPQPEVVEVREHKQRLAPPFIAAFCGGAAGSLLISLIFALI